jgi:hypothetical protein
MYVCVYVFGCEGILFDEFCKIVGEDAVSPDGFEGMRVYIHMYVCMYVCTYVGMCVCLYVSVVSMYLCV